MTKGMKWLSISLAIIALGCFAAALAPATMATCIYDKTGLGDPVRGIALENWAAAIDAIGLAAMCGALTVAFRTGVKASLLDVAVGSIMFTLLIGVAVVFANLTIPVWLARATCRPSWNGETMHFTPTTLRRAV